MVRRGLSLRRRWRWWWSGKALSIYKTLAEEVSPESYIMGSHKADWELVDAEPLGGGGQSDVFLVRTPERTKQRTRSLEFINTNVPTSASFVTMMERSNLNREFAEAIRDFTRPDLLSELGAMKVFKLRDNEEQSLQRLKQEIDV